MIHFPFWLPVIFFCQQNMYSCFGVPISPLPPFFICSAFPVLWFHFPLMNLNAMPLIPSNAFYCLYFSMRFISSFNFKFSLTRMSIHVASDTAYGDMNQRIANSGMNYAHLSHFWQHWSSADQSHHKALLYGLSPSATEGDCHN